MYHMLISLNDQATCRCLVIFVNSVSIYLLCKENPLQINVLNQAVDFVRKYGWQKCHQENAKPDQPTEEMDPTGDLPKSSLKTGSKLQSFGSESIFGKL